MVKIIMAKRDGTTRIQITIRTLLFGIFFVMTEGRLKNKLKKKKKSEIFQ